MEVADLIERFVEGRIGIHEWDDFTSVPSRDPEIEAIRRRCLNLPDEYPRQRKGEYCSEEGVEVLKAMVRQLRGQAA